MNENLNNTRDSKKPLIIVMVIGIALILAALVFSTSHRDPEPLKQMSATELLDLGEKYLHELDYEQALVQFIKVIEIEPMNIRAYLGGTDAHLHLGGTQDATDWLNSGIEVTDNENLSLVLAGVERSIIEGYIALAEAYEAEGCHEKAIELLQRVYDETGDEILGRKLGIVEASAIVFRDDYVIEWKDLEFERLIREYLDKPDGDIHYDDVKLIEKIEIWGRIIAKPDDSFHVSYSQEHFSLGDGQEGVRDGEIKSLADLEHFTSLKSLTVNHQIALDISALADTSNIDCLSRLESLSLNADNLTDISVVSSLIALERLSLSYNNVTDISPISMLIELTSVSISNNDQLASAAPLRGLRKLSTVSLNGITTIDLSVFVGMPELKRMHVVGNENVDYSILTKLNLEYLEITCDDATFQIAKQLTTLTRLRLHGHSFWREGEPLDGLTSIEGIGSLVNLNSLDLLAPKCNDISPLASLNIEELEIELSEDCDLTPLKNIAALTKVIVPRNYSADSNENSLLQRVQALLPNVEVASDRY